jgi:hypothetical protein
LVEKIDFARPVVRRRKSVLKPPDAIGIGSEIFGLYRDEPSELREAGSWWRPLHITQASMKNAPMNMPGKKPAKKTPTGNLLHLGSISDSEELTPGEVILEVAVELVDVAVCDEVAEELLLDEAPVDVEEVSVLPDLLVSAIRLQMAGPD